jgi:hypothetical protein
MGSIVRAATRDHAGIAQRPERPVRQPHRKVAGENPAPRSIPLEMLGSRIEAAIAACKVYGELQRLELDAGAPGTAIWLIIHDLKQARPDLGQVRRRLDELLAVKIAAIASWRTGFLRSYIADIEAALGMPHDPRSAEARAAWDRGMKSWDAYVDELKAREAAEDALSAGEAR